MEMSGKNSFRWTNEMDRIYEISRSVKKSSYDALCSSMWVDYKDEVYIEKYDYENASDYLKKNSLLATPYNNYFVAGIMKNKPTVTLNSEIQESETKTEVLEYTYMM